MLKLYANLPVDPIPVVGNSGKDSGVIGRGAFIGPRSQTDNYAIHKQRATTVSLKKIIQFFLSDYMPCTINIIQFYWASYLASAKVSLKWASTDLSRVDVVADAVVDVLAEILITDVDLNLL